MLNMFEGGPRLTGSQGHKQFLDTVESNLTALGFQMQRDRMQFRRWDTTNYSLTIHAKDGDVEVPVAYPYVRSGLTPFEGVVAPLTTDAGLGRHIYVTSGTMTPLGPVGCSAKSMASVCCISNEPNVQLAGTYQPFTPGIPLHQIPMLMIGSDACVAVKEAAKAKMSATLVLAGTQAKDDTTHVWGLLPGQTDEVVLMGIHSDGQNAVEENGIPSLIQMAKYLAGLPLSQRKRTLGFAAVTGHMDYDVPHHETQGFAALHANDLMHKVVACVAPEHFGTMQWRVTRNGSYAPTGRSCSYTAYASSPKLLGLTQQAFRDNHNTNYVTLTGPVPEEAGSALGWRLHGCPTVGGISLPDYLVNFNAGPERLDKERFFQQASAYMHIIEQLLAGHSI